MLRRHCLTVSDPLTNNMNWVALGKFSLPRSPEVVPDLWPRHQSGPTNDPLKLGPQILVLVSIAVNHEFGSRFGFVERCFHVHP